MVQRSGLDLLVVRNTVCRSGELDPTAIHTTLDQIQLVIGIFAILLIPEIAGKRVDCHAEAVTDPVSEDLLDILAHLAANRRTSREEWIIRRRTAIAVEAQDHTRKVSIVWPRTSKPIIRHCGPEARFGWPRRKVLQLSTTSQIPHQDV